MRAKFQVYTVASFDGWEEVILRAVYSGTPEDNVFAKATPSGELKIQITNPAVIGILKPGKKYYLDFTEAAE